MEFLNIIGSISIKPKWANISGTVLKAGTPISATGTVANNASAIGLLAQDTRKGNSEVDVVYAGLVDINEVKRSYGTLYDNCIAALKGITFINASGSAIVPSGLPSVSSADNGKVLTVSSGAWSAQQPSGGGAPCVVLSMNSSGEVSCSHTASQLAAICTQYGAGDSMGGTVCAVPAVVTGDYTAAGSLWLYVGDMQSSLSSASLREIVYLDFEIVTVINIAYDYGVWGGFYINVPIGGGAVEG